MRLILEALSDKINYAEESMCIPDQEGYEDYKEDKLLLEEVQRYYDNQITFEDLFRRFSSFCPPNACEWCEDDCDTCIIRGKATGLDRCRICWLVCLGEEVDLRK